MFNTISRSMAAFVSRVRNNRVVTAIRNVIRRSPVIRGVIVTVAVAVPAGVALVSLPLFLAMFSTIFMSALTFGCAMLVVMLIELCIDGSRSLVHRFTKFVFSLAARTLAVITALTLVVPVIAVLLTVTMLVTVSSCVIYGLAA